MGFRRKYNITRTTGSGHLDDVGNWVDGTTKSIIPIKASVQPLNAQETQALEEGNRNARTVKLYTSTRLLPEKQAYIKNNVEVPQQEADTLDYDSGVYKITSCELYQSGVINHYKCMAQEVTGDN